MEATDGRVANPSKNGSTFTVVGPKQIVIKTGPANSPGVTIVVGAAVMTIAFNRIFGGSGATVTITNASTLASPTVGLTIQDSEVLGGAYSVTGDCALTVLKSSFKGDANMFVTVINQARLQIQFSDMQQAGISSNVAVTSGPVTNVIGACTVDHSTVTFSGTADIGTGAARRLDRVRVTDNSAVTVTCSALSVANAAADASVQIHSTLSVGAVGSISDARISTGFELTTGAFAHTNVSAEGNFTQTLTANNPDTYRGFGANTLV